MFIFIASHVSSLHAQKPASTPPARVAVLTLKNKLNSHQGEIAYLTAMIRGEVARQLSTSYLVMTEANVLALLPADKPLEECVSDCQITLGREIGAAYIITGEVVRFGQSLRLFILLHNTHSGRLVAQEIARAKTIEEIETPTQEAVTRLLGQLTERRLPAQSAHPKTKRDVKTTAPQPELNVTSPAVAQDPTLAQDQSQRDLKWSVSGELGVTQHVLDDIDNMSFGLSVRRLLSDYFHVSLNLHSGKFSNVYDEFDESVEYTIQYLNLLPAFGCQFAHEAWTFYAELGVGVTFGSQDVYTSSPTSSSSGSTGMSSPNLTLGGGLSYQLSRALGVGLAIRYLSIDSSEVGAATIYQNTLALSWAL